MFEHELRALLEKATPEPWIVGASYDADWTVFRLSEMNDPRDPQEISATARLMAFQRNRAPEVAAVVEAARRAERCMRMARAILRKDEDSNWGMLDSDALAAALEALDTKEGTR